MVNLPKGVLFIFSVGGQVRVSQLEQLREGCAYVCSSKNYFRQLPYGRQDPPRPLWNMESRARGIQGTASTAATSHLPSSCRMWSRLIAVIRNGVSPEVAV
ncbi:hypothetical protein HPB48_015498 [Haemaphysalis longicornis]|uniref:Doublecortin domain-containing protein n=1 Tax=Haemaphysalis longicornis TaxID=44386 RepID=A0A9J6FKR6_HAELO|nr:hypothetical protein HPB48_015498 [Haemaphysalis longicornis]